LIDADSNNVPETTPGRRPGSGEALSLERAGYEEKDGGKKESNAQECDFLAVSDYFADRPVAHKCVARLKASENYQRRG